MSRRRLILPRLVPMRSSVILSLLGSLSWLGMLLVLMPWSLLRGLGLPVVLIVRTLLIGRLLSCLPPLRCVVVCRGIS